MLIIEKFDIFVQMWQFQIVKSSSHLKDLWVKRHWMQFLTWALLQWWKYNIRALYHCWKEGTLLFRKLLYYYSEHFMMPSLVPHIMLSEDLCRNSILPTSAGQSLRFLVARCRSRGGPPLFLDQTEAQRAKKTFWRLHPPPPAPPFSKGQFSSPYIMTLTGT